MRNINKIFLILFLPIFLMAQNSEKVFEQVVNANLQRDATKIEKQLFSKLYAKQSKKNQEKIDEGLDVLASKDAFSIKDLKKKFKKLIK